MPAVLEEELFDSKSLLEISKLLKKHGFYEGGYYTLGLNLGLSKETMDDIKRKHKKDATGLLECLKAWLHQNSDVKGNGSPTIFTLNKALLKMGEDKVAHGIHKEKHPSCEIFSQHQERLKDVLPEIYLFLLDEGVIGEMLLPDNFIEKVQLLLDAVRDGVCLNHHNLEKLALIITEKKMNTKLGIDILDQYRRKYTKDARFWITYGCNGGVIVHLTKSMIVDTLVGMQKKWDYTITSVSQATKEVLPMKDLRRYLTYSHPTLLAQLEVCKTNDDILELVKGECSLSNIRPMESIVNQFEVQAAKPFIKEYRASVAKLFDDIPLRHYFIGSAAKVTLVIGAGVDKDTFNDIECLLDAYVSHFDLGIKSLICCKKGTIL